MAILKSFESVSYSDKVEYKSIFLRPVPSLEDFRNKTLGIIA